MNYYEINENIAQVAHEMNHMRSYNPNETTVGYKQQVDEVAEIAEERKAKYPEEAERIDYLLDKYARRLAEWYNENSRVEAMCPSVLISGAGNFPTRKKEKQNARRDAMMNKWKEVESIAKRISSCGSDAIKSNDARALEKLRLKLERLEDSRDTMKEANAYYEENKTLDGCPGVDDNHREWLTREGVFNHGEHGTPLEMYGRPFTAYSINGVSAEIRRVKERIAKLEAVKEAGTQEQSEDEIGVAGLSMVENAEAMRVQLIFDGKPDEAVRDILKSHGFRWSPRFTAWQRELTPNGKFAAKQVIEELKKREGEKE